MGVAFGIVLSLVNARRTLRLVVNQARDALASIIVPAPCRLCEGLLDTTSYVPICAPCLNSMGPLPGPRCSGCGGPIISAHLGIDAQPKCRLCRIGAYGFYRARSYALYQGAMIRSIVLLKHERIPPLGS